MKRRTFLRNGVLSSLVLSTGLTSMASEEAKPKMRSLTILHTNDTHSRIDPFPMDGSRNQGLGGVAKRSTLINKIRSQQSNVLLFDSGDYFQGTPYFNFFEGELEIKLMSAMGYDAATLGNHDFDAGIDTLVKQLKLATFPIIIANYDFTDTALHGKTLPYKIFKKDGIKIGVFGIGIELQGLVPKKLYKNIQYLDPIKIASESASLLKNEFKCNYVICLSHLGYKYNEESKISDIQLAKSTNNIDLILGGHTHTFLQEPTTVANAEGRPVLINQAGWAGMVLGRVDVSFEKSNKSVCTNCENILIKA